MPIPWVERPYTVEVPGEGEASAQIAVIGEGPGAEETRLGRPFAGISGRMFWQLAVKYAWIDKGQCYTDNLSQRRLNDDLREGQPKLDDREFEFWRESLTARLSCLRPRLVLAVGALATKALLGRDVSLHVAHGLPHLSGVGTVFPVYHPAAALRGDSNSLSLTAYDLEQAGKWWRGELEESRDEGPEDTKKSAIQHSCGEVAIDTEYHPKTGEPICFSYTWTTGEAFVVWADDQCGIDNFIHTLRVGRTTGVIFHSAEADLRPLRLMGIDIDGWGIPWRDTREMAYLLRHEPQGLKDLAERHLALRMETYESVVARHCDPGVLRRADSWVNERTQISPIERVSPKTGREYKKPRGGKVTRDAHTKKVASALRRRDIPALTELLSLPEPSLKDVPKEAVEAYALRDPDATLRIYSRFAERVRSSGLAEVEALDNAVIPMFDRMREVGLLFDEEAYERLRAYVGTELEKSTEFCRALSGLECFNPGSSDQVALWCRDEYKRSGRCKLYRRTNGGDREAADKRALSRLIGEHPIIQAVLEYRSLAKLKSSYVDKLPKSLARDGRYHPDWRLKGVETGRAAEWILTFPSRTELGRRVRACFVAPEGYEMASFDLSQIEYRLTAALSQDEAMLEAYRSGRDLHHLTVERLFGGDREQRHAAKVVNFRMLYGGGINALFEGLIQEGVVNADRSPKFSKADCAGIISDWFAAYPGVRGLIDKTEDFIRRTGYSRTELGRRRYLPAIYLEGDRLDYLREEAIRQGFNHVIQGTAQEVIKRAMVRVWGAMGNSTTGTSGRNSLSRIQPLLQYHDELVFQGPEGCFEQAAPIIVEAMTADSERYGIPLESKVVIGPDWGSLKG